MPEIFASPDQNANLDRCWTCRSMFMQAWGHYGTAWAAVHQQLGVRPDLGRGRLEVVPQVPDGQTRVEGSDIRLGDAGADVLATHSGRRYRTVLDTSGVDADRVRIGHTLPRGADVAQVTLDGRRLASHDARVTNRGLEVSVAVGGGRHTLVVTAG
jgi:hypothetical protein